MYRRLVPSRLITNSIAGLLLAALMTIALPSSAQAAASQPAVAILYFDYTGSDAQLGVLRKGLAQMLISHIQPRVSKVQIVERERIEDLFKELELAQSGKVDPATAAKVGKLMRTDRSVYESHSVRNSDKSTVTQVPLRSLRSVLGLHRHVDANDDEYEVVHVEPGATVGEVSDFLLKQKKAPLQLECCLEMEDATLGGLAMAQGMTTHSHMCGLLCETGEEEALSFARLPGKTDSLGGRRR